MTKEIKRILLMVAGWACLALGIAGLFLPFLQGILLIMIGLGILSTEYAWAHRWVTRLKDRFPGADRQFQRVRSKVLKRFSWLGFRERPPE